jgi:LPS export ABC transporter protein LptC
MTIPPGKLRITVGSRRPALATALCLGVLAACEQPMNTPVADEDIRGMDADNIVFGMTSYMTASGVREGRIRADTAYTYEESATAELLGMEIVFYDDEGRERATVDGLRGRWSQDTDVMSAFGDVVLLVHSDSSRLESQEIHYDPSRDLIWSDSATVRIMRDGTVTRGSSFESDMSFENIVVRDPRGGARRIF